MLLLFILQISLRHIEQYVKWSNYHIFSTAYNLGSKGSRLLLPCAVHSAQLMLGAVVCQAYDAAMFSFTHEKTYLLIFSLAGKCIDNRLS